MPFCIFGTTPLVPSSSLWFHEVYPLFPSLQDMEPIDKITFFISSFCHKKYDYLGQSKIMNGKHVNHDKHLHKFGCQLSSVVGVEQVHPHFQMRVQNVDPHRQFLGKIVPKNIYIY